jgi:hypothetical protein
MRHSLRRSEAGSMAPGVAARHSAQAVAGSSDA